MNAPGRGELSNSSSQERAVPSKKLKMLESLLSGSEWLAAMNVLVDRHKGAERAGLRRKYYQTDDRERRKQV